ncbi:MAG: Hexuronate transporter [Haliscomenobacter sp.]|nr:Hexuronate transporter [Haliscomenobacter sp.]
MDQTTTKIGRYRWRILAMLFAATTINYMDRSVIGVLAPTLQHKVFGWTDADYGYISASFQLAYGIGMLAMGALIDKIGTRWGYTLSIAIWSVFGMLHATIRPAFSFVGFALARFGLGFGESGNFPSCIKTVAEWFPKKERAFATGIFNAGSNVGAIMAPLIIPLIVSDTGHNWQYAFLTTGVFSAIWVVGWLSIYRKPEEHPKLSASELAYIKSDSNGEETTTKVPWGKVLPLPQTWAFAIAKLTDAVWWFYLFWGGKYIAETFGLNIRGLGLPLIIIYVVADVGSIAGGWLSGFFMSRGWSVNKARKITLLICALIILPVMFVTLTDNKWLAVALIALGAGGHQAWSANVFTLVSDVFPKKATATVVGIGGAMGAFAGLAAHITLGELLTASGPGAYFFAFLIAGLMYLTVLGVAHLLMPKMTPLGDDLKPVYS